MNIENLKDLWSQEKIEETPEISTQQQNEIHLPLEKIRSNMRKEFWWSGLSIFALLGFILLYTEDANHQNIFLIMLFVGIVITAYYKLKFYALYKKINTQDFSTYRNLLNLKYELVLNAELYKSYYLSFVPIFIGVFIAISPANKSLFMLILIVISIVITTVIFYFSGRLWFQEFYGTHIQKISNIIDEINDETDDFHLNRSLSNFNESFPIFSKIKAYFDRKFGKYGVWVYTFFLFVVFYIICFLLGFIIGLLGASFDLISPEDINFFEH